MAFRSRQDGKAECRELALPMDVLVAAPDESAFTAVFVDGTRRTVPNLTVGDARRANVERGQKTRDGSALGR